MINPFFFPFSFSPPLLCTWSWHMFLSLCGGMRYGCYPSHIKIIAFPLETRPPPAPVSTLTQRELSFSPGLQLPLLHLASVSTSSTNRHHLPLRATTTAAASESGFPLCNTLFLFCSLYLSPSPPPSPPPSPTALCTFPFHSLCVSACARTSARVCALVRTHIRAFERKWVWQGLKGNTCAPGHIGPLLFPPILPPRLLLLLLLIVPPPLLALQSATRTPISAHIPLPGPALPLGASLHTPQPKVNFPFLAIFCLIWSKPLSFLDTMRCVEVFPCRLCLLVRTMYLWEVIHARLVLWRSSLPVQLSSDSVSWMRSRKQNVNSATR